MRVEGPLPATLVAFDDKKQVSSIDAMSDWGDNSDAGQPGTSQLGYVGGPTYSGLLLLYPYCNLYLGADYIQKIHVYSTWVTSAT